MAASFIYRRGYLLIHLLVFLGLLLLLCQPLAWDVNLPSQFWVKQSILFILWVCLFYLNIQVLVPQLLFKNRIGRYAAAILGAVVFVVLANMLVDLWLNLPELMHRTFNPNEAEQTLRTGEHGKHVIVRNIKSASFINPIILLATLMVAGMSTSIKVIEKWQKNEELRQNLEQQKISSELSFLKAQINPHFFFNTLHSIYALTMTNVETAREALHTLSRMMRYVLYETQSGTTLLSKETEFLEDYINLMKLRLTEKVTVTFDKSGIVRDVPVAPMLFHPFIENAFKHGVSSLLPSSIQISIYQRDHTLQLDVRNTVLPEKRVVLEESSGIGLVNTRRRLDLMYPGRYTLVITEETPDKEYHVKLTLNIS